MMQIQGLGGSQSLLEQAKQIITEIGNALGLSRTLRSAKLYNINQSRQYPASIASQIKRTGEATKISANPNRAITQNVQILEAALENPPVQNNFFPDAGTSLDSTVSVLDRELLDDIYILYPSLSLLWLEASASGKNMLRKKIKTSDAFYTDDGFALGCAYLFEVLDQEQGKKFDGLNWSQTFRQKFASDKSDILLKAEAVVKATSSSQTSSFFSYSDKSEVDDDNEFTRLQVSARRLEMRRREMELLHYSVHAARMIFSYA